MSGFIISFADSTVTTGLAVPIAVSAAQPLPVTLSGGIGGLNVQGIFPELSINDPFPVIVGGRDTATGELHSLQVDPVTGGLLVTGAGSGGAVTQGAGSTANPWTVQGPVASGVALSGNPLRAGGAFNTTPAVVTTGQAVDWQMTSRGFGLVQLTAGSGNPTSVIITPTDNVANSSALIVWSEAAKFNGATWDRDYKPRTAFKLPSSAATNNAANIKTTPGTVLSISGNVTLAGSTCYLKLFDTTGVPNPAALAQLYLFPLNIIDAVFSFNLPAGGLYFPTGIGVALVANPADLDNTAIAAGQITALNVTFQ